ncbi:zinc-binding dehydrogenase [Streptomyces sp. NPDC057298]|uniref:zinc-binding dehydrogenase n=1 Tax=Streptomyces sp. NPDC057298 TaxID=3346091 RepID=UPI00362856F4
MNHVTQGALLVCRQEPSVASLYRAWPRKTAPDGVDAVLDTAGRGSLSTTQEVAALGVRVASITRSAAEYPGAIDVYLYLYLDGDDLTRLVELAEEGKLTVHIDRAFPLEEAAQAQQLLAGGHVRGKVVLETRREEGSASYVRALKKRVESGQ